MRAIAEALAAESSSTAVDKVRSAEQAAKIARLEAEEWKYHAQSLQASLERQRELAAMPSTDSESSSHSLLTASHKVNKGTCNGLDDLATFKRRIVELQECILRREAAIGRLVQKYDRAKKKLEGLYISEKTMQARLDSAQAEANVLRDALRSQTEATQQYRQALLDKNAEIQKMPQEIKQDSHYQGATKQEQEFQFQPQIETQNGDRTPRAGAEELRKKLAMERATSKQLQLRLAAKNEEISDLKASFKAILKDHRHRQMTIGQVLSKLQTTGVH